MFHSLDLSTSGLIAQRQRINTIAGNIANINSTRDADGKLSPFQRKLITFQARTDDPQADKGGVGVKFDIATDTSTPPRVIYNPGHPDADPKGYVQYPDINLTTEFVNAIEASRAYEANVSAVDITKSMMSETLKILA